MWLPSGYRLKLESILRSTFSSSLKIDSYCFSEPSLTSLVASARDLSVRETEEKERLSISAVSSEKFQRRSYCLITNRHMLACPLHRESRVISTQAKQAPTSSSSFSILRKVASRAAWKVGRSSSWGTASSWSLDFWFLKKRVRAYTPSESIYLMSVGNSGSTLKFLLSAIDSSSKLNSSEPIFLVHPSRYPRLSVRMTLVSESMRSMTPAMWKEWKSVITQLQCTFTSCKWNSLLQAQNCRSKLEYLSRSLQLSMKCTSPASWNGFTLKGMISLMERPTRLEGRKPSTPGRFLEIRTIFPTYSRMLMKTTAVRSEKKRSLSSRQAVLARVYCIHRSVSLRQAQSWQNYPQPWAKSSLIQGEYWFSQSMRCSTVLLVTSNFTSFPMFQASTCFLASLCCRNLRTDTPSSAALRKFSRKRMAASSKWMTSSEEHLRMPPRFSRYRSVQWDLRISISSWVRWLLFLRERMISSRKERTQQPYLKSLALIIPKSSPYYEVTRSQPYSLRASHRSPARAALASRKRQYCPSKRAASSPKQQIKLPSKMVICVFWFFPEQKGRYDDAAILMTTNPAATNPPVNPPVPLASKIPSTTRKSSSSRWGKFSTASSPSLPPSGPIQKVWYSMMRQSNATSTSTDAPISVAPFSSILVNFVPSEQNSGMKKCTKLATNPRRKEFSSDRSQPCLQMPLKYFPLEALAHAIESRASRGARRAVSIQAEATQRRELLFAIICMAAGENPKQASYETKESSGAREASRSPKRMTLGMARRTLVKGRESRISLRNQTYSLQHSQSLTRRSL